MTPEHIRRTAIQLAEQSGLENLSRNVLCSKAGVPAGSFTHIMGKSFKAFVRELAKEGHGRRSGVAVTRRRPHPPLRRAHIVASAAAVAEVEGLDHLTRRRVAEAAGVSEGTVSNYFNTMTQLRRAVVRASKTA